MNNYIALRMDDVGASSKKFNVYSKYPFCNTLFLKYLPPFRAWAPYNELSEEKWLDILNLLSKFNAKLTIGVTACYVNKDSSLIPFYEKFPGQAKIILSGVQNELIEVANHGLSHCIIGKHLPNMFSSNRKNHREFWDFMPREWHFDHIKTSQKILKDWIGYQVSTFIPPGNVYSIDTIDAADEFGIMRINSSKIIPSQTKVNIINEDSVYPFHDREIELYGIAWLESRIKELKQNQEFTLIRDL